MYWLKVIWAIYLVVLSFVPCSDAVNRCADSAGTHKITLATEHDHQEDSDDNCTPFCHCTCCSISITLTDTRLVPLFERILPDFITKKVYIKDHFLPSDYFGNIWQPPRLTA